MLKHAQQTTLSVLVLFVLAACGSASPSTGAPTTVPSAPTTAAAPTSAPAPTGAAVPTSAPAPTLVPLIATSVPAPTAEAAVPTSAPTEVAAPTSAPVATAAPAATDAPAPTATAAPSGGTDQVVGTVVRFSTGSTSVDVTIGEDNPTVRDFLSLLPLSMTLEEFNGREKIGYFSRPLTYQGSPGSDPEDGDLIYYTPWGNLGFYYNTSGIEYSDQTIHIGTYNATREQLAQLEGQPVSVEIVR